LTILAPISVSREFKKMTNSALEQGSIFDEFQSDGLNEKYEEREREKSSL
jgi:hypothetical protein